MRSDYDCIVVGGGPGGAAAAKAAAESGARVILLEKDREVGIPVRCGEAVGVQGLTGILEPDPKWISNIIHGIVLVAPDGREVVVDIENAGYMLDRRIFDYDLVQIASSKGAEVLTKAYVYDIIKPNGVVQGVRVQHLGEKFDIRGQVIIGADGVESRIGRWGGLRTNMKMRDMESCMQMTLSNISVDKRYIYFYLGKEVAPGGYLWIFPKSDTVANVGIGVSGEFARHKSAQRYLKEFIDSRFPNAAILYTVVGGVPCSPTLKKITNDGLMLVGDAAHQVNPISGGGINAALVAGSIAGKIAAQAIREGDVSDKRLQAYPVQWHKRVGKSHERFYRIKQAVYKLTDEDLNHTADSVLRLPEGKRTLVGVFKSALFRHPSLFIDIVKAFM